MLDESDYEYLEFQEINNKRLELVAIKLREEMPQLFNLMVDEYAPIDLVSIACQIDETFPKLFAILERDTENQLETWCEKENEYQKSNTDADDPANYLKRDARR